MTMRLSIISFAGMVRTLVAVGTLSEASMFAARDFAMPLSGVTVFSAGSSASVDAAGTEVAAGACAGIGWRCGGAEVVRATGWLPVIGTEAGGTDEAAGAEAGAASGASITTGAGEGAGAGSEPDAGGGASSRADWWYFSRIGHHDGSTEFLSVLNCSYISSTSHSLAPNSPAAPPSGLTPVTWLDTADRPLPFR